MLSKSGMSLDGRDSRHTRTHVELCCGRYMSSLIYHLSADRTARALAIDIQEWSVIRDRIPIALRPRIVYVQRDVEHLTYEELDRLCRQVFGAHTGLAQIDSVHWSPPCETMSVSLSARGRHKHRHPDGRAKSATAIKHDRCFDIVAGILECLVKANSAVLVSVENPRSPTFLSNSSLRRLAAQPGWRLIDRTDYCKNADCCADDVDHDWPRKPTSLLLIRVGIVLSYVVDLSILPDSMSFATLHFGRACLTVCFIDCGVRICVYFVHRTGCRQMCTTSTAARSVPCPLPSSTLAGASPNCGTRA